jgi:hypothetical protein
MLLEQLQKLQELRSVSQGGGAVLQEPISQELHVGRRHQVPRRCVKVAKQEGGQAVEDRQPEQTIPVQLPLKDLSDPIDFWLFDMESSTDEQELNLRWPEDVRRETCALDRRHGRGESSRNCGR